MLILEGTIAVAHLLDHPTLLLYGTKQIIPLYLEPITLKGRKSTAPAGCWLGLLLSLAPKVLLLFVLQDLDRLLLLERLLMGVLISQLVI